ncbi:glycine, glutamate and proline-rich protein-like [Littorina saxatilis]|uniref:Lysozyme g n=1 Tax=Littorina saxatilis TaxID=31220 RepID=A0AAN9G2U1_9CAEN
MYLLLCLVASLASSALAATSCYGNVNNLRPTGKHSGGTSASHSAVAAHLHTLTAMKSCYEQVANSNCIEASVIAALASRESNGGDSLTSAGYGDGGHAWGILQCDLTHSGLPCKNCGARTCCHVEMMVKSLLVPYIRQVGSRHSSWSTEQKLQGGIAAYNFGVGNVQSWTRLDIGSTGNDYSNDVIARAQYLKSHGWS